MNTILLALFSCSGTIVESEQSGWPAYDWLPDHHLPSPQTRTFVKAGLSAWQLRSTVRDKDVALFVELHRRSPKFWAKLEEKRGEYQFIVRALRDAHLPVVFAGLAYQASQLEAVQAKDCRAGPWMLPLETPQLVRGPCHLRGPVFSWSLGEPGSPIDEGGCMIMRCATDLRYELASSTKVAARWLEGLYQKNGRDALDTMVEAALGPPEAAIAQHLLAACADPTLGEASYCEDLGLTP